MGVEFLLTAFIVVVTPGTGVVFTLATGLTRGFRASVFAAIGCTIGILPHLVAAIVGLAALLHASAVAFQIVKYLGVAYLLFLAWQVLRERGALRIEPTPRGAGPAPGPVRLMTTAVLINFLNPKLSIFFLAFLPQFVSVGEPHSMLRMVELSAVFMLMTFVVFAGYGLFAAKVRDHVVSRPRIMAWLRRTFAAAFVGLSAHLAFASRG